VEVVLGRGGEMGRGCEVVLCLADCLAGVLGLKWVCLLKVQQNQHAEKRASVWYRIVVR
jgi:hypothetical protein